MGPVVRFVGKEVVLFGDYQRRVGPHDLTVPAGFRSDLASIPRLLWPLIGRHELSAPAAIIHDWLYQRKGLINGTRLSRREVDRLFRVVMSEEGVAGWRRWGSWGAVRLFGWMPWRPEKAAVWDALLRAFHTAWQTGVAVWAATEVWQIPLIAAGLSIVKGVGKAWLRR